MAAVNANRSKSLLRVNTTVYARTRKSTALTYWLPDATESNGEPIEIKDADGSAGTRNITVKTLEGQTIDGASTFTISTNYGSVVFRSNGQQWYSLSQNASTGAYVTEADAASAVNRVMISAGLDRTVDDSTLDFTSNVLENTAAATWTMRSASGQPLTISRTGESALLSLLGTNTQLMDPLGGSNSLKITVPAKTTPVDADSWLIKDSADSNKSKWVTGANAKTYFVTTDYTTPRLFASGMILL